MATKQPEIIEDKDQMRKWSRAMRSKGNTIGLVPTMGYLHEGHISLIREAHKHAQLVVVSIYVNPGQFSPSEDLSTYPSDFHGDIQKLMAVPGGVDAVFHPYNLYNHASISGKVKDGDDSGVESKGAKEKGVGVVSCLEDGGLGHQTWVRVERLEKGLCGKSRPVFFRGVASVVTKLFNIVEPDIAVFGKKDYQQWRIIQRMVSSEFFIFYFIYSWKRKQLIVQTFFFFFWVWKSVQIFFTWFDNMLILEEESFWESIKGKTFKFWNFKSLTFKFWIFLGQGADFSVIIWYRRLWFDDS